MHLAGWRRRGENLAGPELRSLMPVLHQRWRRCLWKLTMHVKPCPRCVPKTTVRDPTPSTGLRHPSFLGGRCRKAMLGVWFGTSLSQARPERTILRLTGR